MIPPSHELSLADVRAVFALIAEVSELWADPTAWRERFLRGACDLTQSHIGSIAGQTFNDDMTLGEPARLAVVGMPPELQKALFDRSIEQSRKLELENETTPALAGLRELFSRFAQQGWVTVSRSEISTDEEYHACPTYRLFRRLADCDDYVMSVRQVDRPSHIEVITLDRPHGAARFTPREVTLLTLLHSEIAPLIGVRLATEEHFSRDGLSGRLRQVLDLLLQGLSEKEVADRLSLSHPTVHSHVGIIYNHFNVCSRAELMAYFIKRQPKLR